MYEIKSLKRFWTVCLTFFLLFACSDDDGPTPPVNPNGTRYNEAVFSDVTRTNDIPYGTNMTQGGATKNLLLDLYEPEGDSVDSRPLVVLIHGGGFTGGDKEDFEELAEFLAQSGFVVASIAYRLIDIDRTDEALRRGVIDAVADAKAAVRFLRVSVSNGNPFKIDDSQIFLGGYSAGAVTGLHYGYLDKESEVETIGGQALVDYVNARGGLEGNSGNNGVSSDITGVINIAGGLLQASFLEANDPILFSAHGTDDQVVLYLSGTADGSGVSLDGSGVIHPVANAVGITNTLKAIEGGGHGAFFEEVCSECQADLRQFIFENLK